MSRLNQTVPPAMQRKSLQAANTQDNYIQIVMLMATLFKLTVQALSISSLTLQQIVTLSTSMFTFKILLVTHCLQSAQEEMQVFQPQ